MPDIDALWLLSSPSFKQFDNRLIRFLAKNVSMAAWEYFQTEDDGSSIDEAVRLLHDYLKFQNYPLHLVGHGISGIVGLIYARRYPDNVRSLTLLSVGSQVAATWQAHYYVQRALFPFRRHQILTQMARSLLGSKDCHQVSALVKALEIDLNCAPSPHSLFKLTILPPGGVTMPLMVCGSQTDPIVDPESIQSWQEWMKEGDRLWLCSDGRHFFHNVYPYLVGQQILNFWQSVTPYLYKSLIAIKGVKNC